jgi:hypothetical protein
MLPVASVTGSMSRVQKRSAGATHFNLPAISWTIGSPSCPNSFLIVCLGICDGRLDGSFITILADFNDQGCLFSFYDLWYP